VNLGIFFGYDSGYMGGVLGMPCECLVSRCHSEEHVIQLVLA